MNLYQYCGNNGVNFVDPSGDKFRPRLPDYVAIEINFGTWYGWSGQVSIDRYGKFYVAPLGFNLGKSLTIFSGSITGGWYDKRKNNDKCEKNFFRDFLEDPSG